MSLTSPPPVDAAGEIHLRTSMWRAAGVAFAGMGFIAVAVAYLLLAAPPWESYPAFAMYAGILLGLFGVVAGAREATRRGDIVSFGPRGIFDRRLSTDWVPWTAIRRISSARIRNNSMLLLQPYAEADQHLPFTAWARKVRAANARIEIDGYAIGATTLAGGFPALIAAMHATAPAPTGRVETYS